MTNVVSKKEPVSTFFAVTSKDVSKLFSFLGLNYGQIRPITGGWSYSTFEIEPESFKAKVEYSEPGWIFRFPRNSVVTENLQKEQAVLPIVASRVDFSVPHFEHAGRWNGQPYVGYRRIPGRALSARPSTGNKLLVETAGSIGAALSSLHDIPTSLVAEACAVEPTSNAWRQRYSALREEVRTNVLPVIEYTDEDAAESTLDAVERGFDRFLDDELATLKDVALVHCDLGCEHILIGDDGTTVSGLIDFEDATVGDPTIDFVGIYVTYGMEAVKRVRDYYVCELDEQFERRLRSYTWMASCHEVIYGMEEGRSDLVEDGVAGLRTRLESAGLL